MPTIVGLRRRGYTPESIQLFCERIGVSKADGWIDMSTLEGALRDDLDPKAPRAIAVLRPLKLIIDNFPEGESRRVQLARPPAPSRSWACAPSRSRANCGSSRKTSWKCRCKGYFRFSPPQGDPPGSRVRLRHGYVVECTGFDKDADGKVTAVHVKYFEDSQVGHAGRGQLQGQGQHPLGQRRHRAGSRSAPVRPPVPDAQPDAGGKDFMARAQSERARSRHRLPGAGHEGTPWPTSASSSSATATSWPTASIRRRASRCSTASPR